jgi:hypothetical protein
MKPEGKGLLGIQSIEAYMGIMLRWVVGKLYVREFGKRFI